LGTVGGTDNKVGKGPVAGWASVRVGG
jgi:hypothetical protein